MRTYALALITILAFAGAASAQSDYPATRKSDASTTLHGVEAPDPYHWLEEINSDEVKQWAAGQNGYTAEYLTHSPWGDRIRQMQLALNSVSKFFLPTVKNGREVWRETPPASEQSVLLTRMSNSDKITTLVDPMTFAADGSLAIGSYRLSPDGRYLVYRLRKKGTQQFVMYVESTVNKEDRVEILNPSGLSGSDGIGWRADSKGFYYTKTVPSETNPSGLSVAGYDALYYHALGENASNDTFVIGGGDRSAWRFSSVFADDAYLVARVWLRAAPTQGVLVIPLKNGLAEPAKSIVVDREFKSRSNPMGLHNGQLFMLTNEAAPRQRIVAVNLDRPDPQHWKTIVPERSAVIKSASMVRDKLAVSYLVDVTSVLSVFSADGKHLNDVNLPGLGVVSDINGNPEKPSLLVAFDSITRPKTMYELDLTTYRLSTVRSSKVPFESDQYVLKRVFVPARDGITRVTLFIAHKTGLELNGNQPVLLEGYGGFGFSMTPNFDDLEAVWLQMGGVVAIAAIRGGGEYGEQWYQDGILLNKTNSFDDFVDAAQWLVDNKYTRPSKLGIYGSSNGGLLVSAALNQRPKLFGAVVNGFGLTDMVRNEYAKTTFDWTDEFGSVKNLAHFKNFLGYSPLHNIALNVDYPPVLVLAAELDDRVAPWHQYKYIAALQNRNLGAGKKLLSMSYGTGHVYGKSASTLLAERTTILSFLAMTLGVSPN